MAIDNEVFEASVLGRFDKGLVEPMGAETMTRMMMSFRLKDKLNSCNYHACFNPREAYYTL